MDGAFCECYCHSPNAVIARHSIVVFRLSHWKYKTNYNLTSAKAARPD